MTQGPLKDFLIVDLTHRLPGPFGSHLLANLGARVIKVEDQKFGDAFTSGFFAQMDNSFPHWYQSLNQNKEILTLNFQDDKDIAQLKTLIEKSDAIIQGLPLKVQKKLGLTNDDIKKMNGAKVVIDLGASKTGKSFMHDLNAMAMTGLLKLHTHGKKDPILAPPFLPIAGIALGNKMALELLAYSFEAQKNKKVVFQTTYLYEATHEMFGPFWPKACRDAGDVSFLHNGRYPCYSLYLTKDEEYIALAAVEEKFWIQFTEIFKLDLTIEDRFYFKDQSVFNKISECLSQYTQKEIEEKASSYDICLSLV